MQRVILGKYYIVIKKLRINYINFSCILIFTLNTPNII